MSFDIPKFDMITEFLLKRLMRKMLSCLRASDSSLPKDDQDCISKNIDFLWFVSKHRFFIFVKALDVENISYIVPKL
jgi:hypothetical protein